VSLIDRARGVSSEEIWGYHTRTLTQAKFPFWSAIITLTRGSVSVPGNATAYVEIRPPTGETWYITLGAFWNFALPGSGAPINLESWDGTTAIPLQGDSRVQRSDAGYARTQIYVNFTVIITNSLWCRLAFTNPFVNTVTGHYGYSGFKLSHPQWSPVRNHNLEPKPSWRRPLSKPLPPEIAPLRRYAYDVLGADPAKPEEYDTVIILEENTPLAVDPNTNQPVELLTVVVRASVLADMIEKFKTGELDPITAGYDKYLDRWRKEGIRVL
jgi:hypothetical protein